VTRWTGAALLARIGDKHFVFAVRAANASKTFFEIPAFEKGGHAALDDRTPESVFGLIMLIADLLEGGKMFVDQMPQVGVPRIARSVQNGQFGARGSHEENAVSIPRSEIAGHTASPPIPCMAE
jgi:hypothetical protein